jgi:23S rRNA (adenine2503-C2)-methyltransferase
VRCAFCASGRHGLVRNLQPAEIVDQVIAASRELGRRVDNVVVMGMGEPLLNLEALVPALDLLCAADRFGLGARHVTISTSGIVPGIRHLADLRRQWHLALSLHAVTDEQRARLIPERYRYPLKDILSACRRYRERTGRIVTLEYALIAGTNDATADVKALAAIARDLDAKVNLIPCNPVSGRYTAPDDHALRGFEAQLRRLGAKATVRQRKGERIQAACGQLRQRPVDAGRSRGP